MKVKAIKSDSWQGIKSGDVYETKTYVVRRKEVTLVQTNGYLVKFDRKYFKATGDECSGN